MKKVKLNKRELEVYSSELARVIQELEEVTDAKKTANKEFNTRLSQLSDTAKRLAKIVATGEEDRPDGEQLKLIDQGEE